MISDPLDLRRVDPVHLAESQSRLDELCELVSVKRSHLDDEARRVSVRVGHWDHCGFLSSQLRGFALFTVGSSGRLAWLEGSGSISYAIVPRHSVESQLKTLLTFLANLIDRQGLTEGIRSRGGDVDNIYERAQEVDSESLALLDDQLRVQDWRKVAVSVRNRADSSGLVLDVKFQAPLMDEDQLRHRTPVLRYIYNKMDGVRRSVDRVASAVPNTMRLDGPGVPREIMSRVQQNIENSDLSRYTSHLFRDAYVCGNGFLGITSQPGLRLFRPEDVKVEKGPSYLLRDEVGQLAPLKESVIHLPGALQTSGPYGVSMLEPFIQMLLPVDTAERAVEQLREFPPSQERDDTISRFTRHLDRARAELEERESNVLGLATARLPTSSGLQYFPGFEKLPTDVTSLSLND